MSQADRMANNVAALFHPVSHYDTPEDVLHDAKLSSAEKRAILSSWASDMYAVESQPAVRKIPGIPREIHLDDILVALKQLDDDNEPPHGGGMAMRLRYLSRIDCVAPHRRRSFAAKSGAMGRQQHLRVPGAPRLSRWTREENVRRYRSLLQTELTDLERNYIERRLAEELRG
jgi:hypothetical protein